jgi:transposase-like protein
MGNQTMMIHCNECGVSSPRDIAELAQRLDLRCHVCGAKFSEEALARAQQVAERMSSRSQRP